MIEVHGPRDLPDLRMALIEQWQPDGMFTQAALIQGETEIDGVKIRPYDPVLERRGLSEAHLWWVTEDMSTLIDQASVTLPPTTLTDEFIPDEHGFVVFATPLTGTSADSGGTLPIHAIHWTKGVNASHRYGLRPSLSICTYQFHRAGELIGVHPDLGEIHAQVSGWMPCGTSNWIIGDDTDEAVIDAYADDPVRLKSMSEERRWLATLWLLADEPLAESTIERAARPVARRSQRAGYSSDVRLINVRSRPAPTDGETGEEGGTRNYTHRWIVGGDTGGFWRQQAYGPGHSLRKPKFIAPYIAGPDDKPLRLRDSVKVVRGE